LALEVTLICRIKQWTDAIKRLATIICKPFMHHTWSIFNISKKNRRLQKSLDVNCPFQEAFYRLHGWHSNSVTLIGDSLTSHVITLTLILAKVLTSDPYNCWPLLLRKSVIYKTVYYPTLRYNFYNKLMIKLFFVKL